MDLTSEVGRLADAAERLLEADERRARDAQHAELAREWAALPPPQFGLTPFLKGIPGLAGRFARTVPDTFVAQTGDDELTIACPCGGEPIVRRGALTPCDCGRWFLYDGRKVHVAPSPPVSGPPVPAPEGGPDTPPADRVGN